MQTLEFYAIWKEILRTDTGAWAKQRAFIESLHNATAYVGGFGSGKTLAGCLRTYLLANHVSGNRIIVARRTYRELVDSTRRTFMEWLPRELFVGERKQDDIVFLRARDGGVSEVWFRSLNNPEKFKSAEIGAFWIDEATEATEDEYKLLLGRLRLIAAEHFRPAYLTTNPCPKSHWLYKKFVEEAGDKSLLIRASTYENKENLPSGYIEELERNYPADWIEMYLKGEFGITLEGIPCTPGFKPVVEINGVKVPWHVAPHQLTWDDTIPLKRGWDPGRVRPACVVWQVTKSGQWRKLWEFMGHNQPGNVFIPSVKTMLADRFPGAFWHDYADPQVFEKDKTDGRSWYDELTLQGINIIKIPRTSPSSRSDVFNRMLTQTTRDGQPLVVISPECEISIEAYRGGYHRRKPELGKPTFDDPVKDGYYEHIVDADGYTIVGNYQQNTSSSPQDKGKLRAVLKRRAKSYG